MKKVVVILMSLLTITAWSQGQETKTDSIQTVIGVSPEYPGGAGEMSRFIGANFEYPEEAKKNGEQGTIWIEFIVMSDGELDSIKVVKGVSLSLDSECIRVIEAMPIWSPGEQNVKPVNVRYTIPIKAKLAPQKKKRLFKRKR
jgi:TonB family protein